MNEKPKTFWQKSWPTPPWFRIWAILLALALVVMTYLIASRSFGLPDWPTVIILTVFSMIAATLLLVFWFFVRWFCWFCWHHWRRALFLLACLVTVIALFYAEEDWRGWHAWDQYRRAGEARGEHFDLASLVPPPVPDDQNFALSPIIYSIYGSYFDPSSHEIRQYTTNVVTRLNLDSWWAHYDATNLTGDWTRSVPTDFHGMQQFYRNLAAKTNLFPVPAIPQSPAADVLLALNQFNPVIEELRQASQLPESRFPLGYDQDEILLPHLGALKETALFLRIRAIAELQTGQVSQALTDVALMERLVDSVRTEPILISHLVRLSMVKIMLQPVWEGLADHQWSEAQLVELGAGLAKFDFAADYKLGVHGERALLIQEIRYLRDHPKQHPDGIPLGVNSEYIQSLSFQWLILSQFHLVPAGWYYQNQLHCARLMDQYLAAASQATHAFSPGLAAQAKAILQNERRHVSAYNTLECFLLSIMEQFSGPDGMVFSFAQGQSSVDLARVAIALERYRLAHGQYPESLAMLDPQYLNPVPNDVIGGQPLHYRLAPDGQFVLYSIGWNQQDDGGVVVSTKGSDPRSEEPGSVHSQGDWVWRYPAK
jgi:hypothetical protein